MLGHTLFARMHQANIYEVRATARNAGELSKYFPAEMMHAVIGGIDVDDFDALVQLVAEFRPDCIINCIGIIKQLAASAEHIPALSINSLFPHRLAQLCKVAGARLIHISSDCVFDGVKGMYSEEDVSNASDLYGRTKFLGEVTYPHCITLRTSIIGHELGTRYGLVEWFLAQKGSVNGFSKAVFSGFPTVELADIIMNHVLPHPELQGLYHLSSEPVNKHDLLSIIARQYGRDTSIIPTDSFVVDRSLDSSRFQRITGYGPPSWEHLVEKMHYDFVSATHYRERQYR